MDPRPLLLSSLPSHQRVTVDEDDMAEIRDSITGRLRPRKGRIKSTSAANLPTKRSLTFVYADSYGTWQDSNIVAKVPGTGGSWLRLRGLVGLRRRSADPGDTSHDAPPAAIRLSGSSKPASLMGTYSLNEGELVNGHPLYTMRYSTTSEHGSADLWGLAYLYRSGDQGNMRWVRWVTLACTNIASCTKQMTRSPKYCHVPLTSSPLSLPLPSSACDKT